MDTRLRAAGESSVGRGARAACGLAFVALLALALQIASPLPALAAAFANTTDIALPSGGVAAPYPSVITVAGLSGSVTRVTVSIDDLTHNFPDDLELLLVGPQGQKVLLMSDVGGATPVSNVDLTFDDAAGSAIPDAPLPVGTPLAAGAYRPSNVAVGDAFPAPAPAGPYSAVLAAYNLTDPNGDWKLFALNDDVGSAGTISGWSVQIETADLAVSLPATPATVNAGSNLAYTVRATNSGTGAVSNVSLQVPVPGSTTFQSIAAPGGWTCSAPAVGAAGTIACSAASFAVGSADFTVTVKVDPATALGATISSSASVSSAVAEANTANNSASGTTAVTTSADLSVTAVGAPASVNSGATMTIAADVANAGPSNAAGARVTLPIPAGTTFVSLSAPAGWTCTTPAVGAGGEAVCSAPVFGLSTASFAMVVKVDAAVPPATAIASSATIASDTSDAAAGNNTAGDSTTTTTAADVAVTATAAPDPVSAGARLTYSISVTNNGPSNAASAALTTAVPVNTVFVSLDAPAGWTCSAPAVNGTGAVSCSHPSFGVASATFQLVVRVKLGTPVGTNLALNASVASATADGASANNTLTTSTAVTVAADLTVTLTAAERVKPSAELTYTLQVNNAGPEFATSLTLTTAVPAGTTLVSLDAPLGWTCSAPAVGASGAITCTNDALDVTTDTFTIVVNVGAPEDNLVVPNSATIASPTTDGNPANNTSSIETIVEVYLRLYMPLLVNR